MPDEPPSPRPSSQVVLRPIEQEMRTAYIDYAMSVIVGRALPDVRDGLKPVHRRILHGMNEMGITAATPYMKCARVVGEVMGKFHPHGDLAVYDTLVRLAQTFSMRYPLVAGQGNFGSVDGDNAAAMRYTECRLAPIALDVLADIDEDTVDFVPNFDASLKEPVVMPSRLPNLLVNGSSGIAVGMSTNVPPHNLGETCDAIIAVLDRADIGIQELAGIIKGPDFPTAGIIQGRSGILQAYATGRGIIRIRARAAIEEREDGKPRIIVTELPFQVNKSTLLENMADLVRQKRLEDISDLRDESDRDGIRVVIELKRDAVPEVVLNNLFKHTQLETSFGILALALVDNQPRILNLKEIVTHYVDHRVVVVTRRTAFRLRKAQARAHILEGLMIALESIDAVIALIRASRDPDAAKAGLMAQFRLSEEQGKAILEMRLSKLTSLEVENVRTELEEVRRTILDLEDVLARPERVRSIIKDELVELKSKYGDERRTEIVDTAEEIFIEDLIPDETVVVMVTNDGYVKRVPVTEYRVQRRAGKGLTGTKTKEEDYVTDAFITSAHKYLLVFTNQGRVHWLKCYQIPEGTRYAKGKPMVNLLPRLEVGEGVSGIIPVEEFRDDHYLVFATRRGLVKKTALSEYANPRSAGIWAVKLEEGDELVDTQITDGAKDIIIFKRLGRGVRFQESDVRAMGRYTTGVYATKFEEEGDEVVAMAVVDASSTLLTLNERGFGKRTPVADYPQHRRGGLGVIVSHITDKTGPVVDCLRVEPGDEVIVSSERGMVIRIPVADVSEQGRATQGVKVIHLDEGDRVVAVARLAPAQVEAEGGSPGETGEEDPTDGGNGPSAGAS